MAEMFELETNYKGYKVRALPYYLQHEDSLRVLVLWEAWGSDLSLTVDLFVGSRVVLHGLYGHTDCPEKVFPKIMAYAATIPGECEKVPKANILRWMGDIDTLVRVWKDTHQEKLNREARAREILDAA